MRMLWARLVSFLFVTLVTQQKQSKIPNKTGGKCVFPQLHTHSHKIRNIRRAPNKDCGVYVRRLKIKSTFINTVSSCVFSTCAPHIWSFMFRGLVSRRTSWRRIDCEVAAGWRSSSEQIPGRLDAATQLRPAAGGRCSCFLPDRLMTCLRPPGSHSSWKLSPGLGPQTYGKQVWSSGKLLERNGQNKHLQMNHIRWVTSEAFYVTVWQKKGKKTAVKPDVKECERCSLPSHSRPLDIGKSGEGDASHVPISLCLILWFNASSSSSSSSEGQSRNDKQKSWAVSKALWAALVALWVREYLPLLVKATTTTAVYYFPWFLRHLSVI